MPRIVRGSYNGAVLPVQYGGTGQTDLAGIRSSLALLQASELGAANGYATLDSNRKIPLSQIGNVFMKLAIRGPRSLISGDTGTYTIENYDDSLDYVITDYNGTLSRTKDVITYTPNQAGTQGFTINGMQVPVNVGVPGPIGVWRNAEEVPCGASIGISTTPGTYRTQVFSTAGGRVQSCSITQPADLPAGCTVTAQVNFSEDSTGVYVELQGNIPTTEYTGTCQLTVTTVAQAGNPNPSYPLGTQTQTITVKARKYLFQYAGTSTTTLNTGQSASFYGTNRSDPSGLSTNKPAWGTYTVLSGSLPPGLSIDSGYGYVGCHISGTPTTAGNYSAVIRHSAPAGWETQPVKVQDITVNINVTTPVPSFTQTPFTAPQGGSWSDTAIVANKGNIISLSGGAGFPTGASMSFSGQNVIVTTSPSTPPGNYAVGVFVTYQNGPGGGSAGEWSTAAFSVQPYSFVSGSPRTSGGGIGANIHNSYRHGPSTNVAQISSISTSGNIPAGLNVTLDADGWGYTVSGVPTGPAGTYNFSVTCNAPAGWVTSPGSPVTVNHTFNLS